MPSTNFKAFVPDPELRAFLYQQIQELESFVPGTVVLMMDRSEDEKIYRVNLVLTPGPEGIRLQVETDNAFTALTTAKEQAKAFLSKYTELSPSKDHPPVLH